MVNAVDGSNLSP